MVATFSKKKKETTETCRLNEDEGTMVRRAGLFYRRACLR